VSAQLQSRLQSATGPVDSYRHESGLRAGDSERGFL
jgi:hypothetical protein